MRRLPHEGLAVDSCYATHERIITDGDAEIRKADSIVLDLPSVRTHSVCSGLRRGGSRK
jgi:hypothetical protein